MPAQDTSQLKEHILRTFRIKGPCLPTHIASEINMSILFTSAFLSELLGERKLKISNLRVGSSPIYFIPGTEPQLEKYTQHIKGKEKEAYMKLKEKKFLKDRQQEPAIRVALREIKDFAIPFQKENEIIWRYFTIPESDYKEIKPLPTLHSNPQPPSQHIIHSQTPQPIPKSSFHLSTSPAKDRLVETTQLSEQKTPESKESKPLNIFDEKKQIQKKKIVNTLKNTRKKTIKKPSSEKKNEKFFNNIKEYLTKKSIEILDIIGFNKNGLTLKVRINGRENLLIAYNKKRITEEDIINAHKKASEYNLKYIILSLGDQLKKTANLINAIKDLERIEKIE